MTSMQAPPFDDTVQLSDMKVDVSDEAPIVENGPGYGEEPEVQTVTGENQISKARGYAIVAILFFVNLLNYMDRFTIAGVYWVQNDVGPRPMGSKEIDGVLGPPGKTSLLLADHLITG